MLTHVVGKVYIEFTSSLYRRHLHQCPTVIICVIERETANVNECILDKHECSASANNLAIRVPAFFRFL